MTDSPPITRDNADWLKLKLWLGARVRKLQRELQSTAAVPELQHNITRGRIAELLDFLKAVEPEKLVDSEQIDEPGHYFDD